MSACQAASATDADDCRWAKRVGKSGNSLPMSRDMRLHALPMSRDMSFLCREVTHCAAHHDQHDDRAPRETGGRSGIWPYRAARCASLRWTAVGRRVRRRCSDEPDGAPSPSMSRSSASGSRRVLGGEPYRRTLSRVTRPSTSLQIPSGLASCSSGGSASSGKSW